MTTDNTRDYVIIGAGPAGLQMAAFMERARLDYVVLERASQVASFFRTYPRHRQLLSINKRYTGRDDPEFNLRHDWNSLLSDRVDLRLTTRCTDYFPGADDLVGYLEDFATQLRLRIRTDCDVVQVSRNPATKAFEVHLRGGDRVLGRRLIVATGIGTPYVPSIPGIELAEGYETMPIDPQDYCNQSVLILGKGNSAFETASNLIPTAAVIHLLSRQPLELAWNSRFVGDIRAVNNNLLDTYHLKSQNAVIDGVVHSIERASSGAYRVKFASIHAENETEQLEYDRVLRCTGFRFDDSIFDGGCRPRLTVDDRFPVLTSGFEAEGVSDMFFIGAPMQSLDYRRAQSAFIHGFRYNIRSLFAILQRRYHGLAAPCELLGSTPRAMAGDVIHHMNRSSSLWQQVGFLADLMVLPERSGDPVRLYRDYPYDYLREHAGELARGRDYYIAMFRLGDAPANAFDHARSADLADGKQSTAIHPVFELFRSGEQCAEFHVLEDFLGDWAGRDYIESAAAFFARAQRGEPMQRVAMTGTRDIVRDANMRLVQ